MIRTEFTKFMDIHEIFEELLRILYFLKMIFEDNSAYIPLHHIFEIRNHLYQSVIDRLCGLTAANFSPENSGLTCKMLRPNIFESLVAATNWL